MTGHTPRVSPAPIQPVTVRARNVEIHIGADGHIAAEAGPGSRVVDRPRLVVLPGLIDLQVNGAAGVDITAEPGRLWEVAAALPEYGVTAFLPTVITSAAEQRELALSTFAAGSIIGLVATPLGLHFEGPMIAASHKGAHPEQWLVEPSLDLVRGWSRESGVAMVTIAPELPGAIEVIRELTARDVIVSIGHTAADTATVEGALGAGAHCFTHLFNAMPTLHHREPGPVGVALDRRVVSGVLADGHHLDERIVRLAWDQLAPDAFLTVSDTTAALGLPPGTNRLGDQTVLVDDGAVRLADGTLAGSAASVLDCIRNIVSATGCTLDEAWHTATVVPATLMGLPDVGNLHVGSRGDLVLLEPESLSVVATLIGGELAHLAEGATWSS